MNVKILGSGCRNCVQLHKHAEEALKQLDVDYEISKVEDMPSIMKYGVMSTPALVINEQVVSSGKVLTVKECETLIKENIN